MSITVLHTAGVWHVRETLRKVYVVMAM